MLVFLHWQELEMKRRGRGSQWHIFIDENVLDAAGTYRLLEDALKHYRIGGHRRDVDLFIDAVRLGKIDPESIAPAAQRYLRGSRANHAVEGLPRKTHATSQSCAVRAPSRILRWVVPRKQREAIEGDLLEDFHENVEILGGRDARRIYWRGVIGAVVSYAGMAMLRFAKWPAVVAGLGWLVRKLGG